MRPLPSLVIVSIVITVLSAAGCQQEAAPPPGPVARVIQQHCSQCHTAGGIAPYPFDTHEQTAALAEAIKTAVVSRTMPPMNAANDGSCHTFQDARWLTDEEVATIAAWADAGAPPEGWLPPLKAEPRDIEANVHLETPNYAVDGDSDDYRCFILDLGFDDTRYLTGFDLTPGTPEVVHHMVAFHPRDDTSAYIAGALADNEAGEGYTCFGSSGVDADIVAVWAPGFPATAYPEETGIPIDGSRPLIVQMHYYPDARPREDSSSLDLAFADAVVHPARIGGWGDTTLALPPGQSEVTTSSFFRSGSDTVSSVHGVLPHMHKRGSKMRLDLVDATQRTCMLDVRSWDFDWQQLHFYDTPLLVDPSDTFDVSCRYDTERDVETVMFGDGTDDEMCFAFLYISDGSYPGAVRATEVVTPDAHAVQAPLGAPPTVTWSRRHGGGGEDEARGVVPQADGGVVVGGWLERDATSYDAVLARYDDSGALTWERPFGGAAADWLEGSAAGPDGGTFVSGATRSSAWTLDGIDVADAREMDALVGAFDADGNALWLRRFGGAGDDEGRRAVRHPDGGVVTLTWHDGTFELEGMSYGKSGTQTTAVIHWSDTGEVLTVDTADTPGGFLNEIAVAPDGSMHAVGQAMSKARLTGIRWSKTASGDTDTVLYPGPSWGWLNDVAVDDDSNVYFVANARGAASHLDGAFESGVDSVVIRISPTGTETVIARFTGPGETRGRSVAVAPNGDVIVAGSFTGALHHAGMTWSARGAQDVFVAKIGADESEWLTVLSGHGDDTYPIVKTDGERTWLALQTDAFMRLGANDHEAQGKRDWIVAALD